MLYDIYGNVREFDNCSIVRCKGGGGSSSGAVDYPDYMKTQHETWLDEIAALITTAVDGGSPFASTEAYDPTTRIATMDTAVCSFNTVVDALSNEDDWESAVDAAVAKIDAAVVDDDYVTADIASYAAILDDQITDVILPAFQTGMRDLNAVYSSAFVMGEATIYGMRDRDVAKYTSELKLKLNIQRIEMIKSSVEIMLNTLMKRVEFEQAVAHYTVEASRIGIVAFKEQTDQDILLDDMDARWDLDVYQYGANMLAGIGGGTRSAGSQTGMSKTQSALSGAAAGASMGTAISPGYGTAIGAVVGGIAGYLSA